jgi:integrase
MYSLRRVSAGDLTLLVDDDEVINAPFSLYLNENFDNPHTREVVAAALRIFHRFLLAHDIDLPTRALDGECLRPVECKWLLELAYRSVEEVERMSDRMIKRLTVSRKKSSGGNIKGAVEPNTAAKRLDTIADFLRWYRENLLDSAIFSIGTRAELKSRYDVACTGLKRQIRGTKQGHHHEIRSLPTEPYLRIIRELVTNPEQLFLTEIRGPSTTMMRDRAIALLAAEGIRPGAIGNLTVEDFLFRPGDPHGYLVIKDNVAKRNQSVTTAVPKAKGTRSTKQSYINRYEVKLWLFTCQAIKNYLDGERNNVLNRRLSNRSKSFLFIAEHGGPIGDRTTITSVFRRLGARLKDLGLLRVARGDPYVQATHYDFNAYTLRHSAATFFFATHKHQTNVLDLMRKRFGWTSTSTSPNRYANRAMSDAASIDLEEYHEELVQMQAARKDSRAQKTTNRSI